MGGWLLFLSVESEAWEVGTRKRRRRKGGVEEAVVYVHGEI